MQLDKPHSISADWLDAHPDFTEAVSKLTGQLSTLEASPDIATDIQTRGFIESGLQLATDAACPLCDTAWPDADALQSHLREKIVRFNEAAAFASAIQAASKDVVMHVKGLRAVLRDALPHASTAELRTLLERWLEDLIAFETQLETISGISDQRDRLMSTDPLSTPTTLEADLKALVVELEGRPDQTASAAARTFLVVADERWSNLRQSKASYVKAAAGHLAASAAYDNYCKSSDEALTKLYQSVEDQFSTFYRAINASDEAAFRAALDPTAGKLDLSVDFYGLGLFPPTAYHSEGHQDGMGICLYLALIRQLLGEEFRFAVLDDVVMSVDSNHRRQFCELLKMYFPNVQFVITTHDEVWARQMQSAGLIGKKAQARFFGWSVDEGPAYELGVLLWDKIEADLDRGDVSAGAARLRRNLESILTDLAVNLRGQADVKPEGDWDLGDLMNAVKGAHTKLLKKASDSANSWNDDAARAGVAAFKEARSSAVLAQEGEQWAVNSALHYNEWANFERADFEPVIQAWKEFLALFTCGNPSCESFIYVSGAKGHEEALRCHCKSYDLNLLKK